MAMNGESTVAIQHRMGDGTLVSFLLSASRSMGLGEQVWALERTLDHMRARYLQALHHCAGNCRTVEAEVVG